MISSYIFHVHTIYLARTLMSFMVVTGPDGNNSSCFQGGCKILSALPSCPALSLSSLLPQANSTGCLAVSYSGHHSELPFTISGIWTDSKTGGSLARHQRALRFFIFVAGIALLCISALNIGQMSGLKEPESSLHSRSVNFLFSNRPATNL